MTSQETFNLDILGGLDRQLKTVKNSTNSEINIELLDKTLDATNNPSCTIISFFDDVGEYTKKSSLYDKTRDTSIENVINVEMLDDHKEVVYDMILPARCHFIDHKMDCRVGGFGHMGCLDPRFHENCHHKCRAMKGKKLGQLLLNV